MRSGGFAAAGGVAGFAAGAAGAMPGFAGAAGCFCGTASGFFSGSAVWASLISDWLETGDFLLSGVPLPLLAAASWIDAREKTVPAIRSR